MTDKFAPLVPVTIMLGCSGFVYYFGSVGYTDSENIQDLILMGRCLMGNESGLCVGIKGVKYVVRFFLRSGNPLISNIILLLKFI